MRNRPKRGLTGESVFLGELDRWQDRKMNREGGGVTTGRPAGGYRFVPRGRHGVPGTRGSVNSSEVCMLRERSFQELPRAIPLGRHQTRRNAVTPTRLRCTLSLSWEGNSAGFSGRICFYHSFLLFFVLHLLVSKVSSILVHVDKKKWHPFDQPLRKIPQIPGISVEGVSGKIIGLVRRHRAWGTFGRTGITRRV